MKFTSAWVRTRDFSLLRRAFESINGPLSRVTTTQRLINAIAAGQVISPSRRLTSHLCDANTETTHLEPVINFPASGAGSRFFLVPGFSHFKGRGATNMDYLRAPSDPPRRKMPKIGPSYSGLGCHRQHLSCPTAILHIPALPRRSLLCAGRFGNGELVQQQSAYAVTATGARRQA